MRNHQKNNAEKSFLFRIPDSPFHIQKSGTKVLAAAYLALNQVGESSSLSGPTGRSSGPFPFFDNSAATKHACVFVGRTFLFVRDSLPRRTGMSVLQNARQSTCGVEVVTPACHAGGAGSIPARCSGNRAQRWKLTHIASVFGTEDCWFDSNLLHSHPTEEKLNGNVYRFCDSHGCLYQRADQLGVVASLGDSRA